MGRFHGIRIVELSGVGPAPMATMLLADLGADVFRIDRLQPSGLGIEKPEQFDLLARGRQSIGVDLKHTAGVACALDLIAGSDGLIEGFRPRRDGADRARDDTAVTCPGAGAKGISAFSGDTPGFRIGRTQKMMGLGGTNHNELIL